MLEQYNLCRSCHKGSLVEVIDFGPQFLQGAFLKTGEKCPLLSRFPLELTTCSNLSDGCGLFQLRHTVSAAAMFDQYWYRSSINSTMRNHLNELARDAVAFIGDGESRRVMDIGCNDGYFLTQFPHSWKKVGVDPSDALPTAGNGIDYVRGLFPSEALLKNGSVFEEKFDVIGSIAVFYDSDQPVVFAKQVTNLLKRDGVWLIEVGYLPSVISDLAYDTICHEHLLYLSIGSIDFIVRQARLKVVHASLNAINGGSVLCYVMHEGANIPRGDANADAAYLDQLRQQESKLFNGDTNAGQIFGRSIRDHRLKLRNLVTSLKCEGKRLHLYGASTKGNTLLQWCDFSYDLFDCAAERNPLKYGAMTLGSWIPIVDEATSRAMQPDYYLVLPWHFRDEIVARETEALASGIQFIFPLPHIEIVSCSGVKRIA